jgi:hypothetical protein
MAANMLVRDGLRSDKNKKGARDGGRPEQSWATRGGMAPATYLAGGVAESAA